MDARSLKYIAEACGGEQLKGSPEAMVDRVCSDSRHAQAGDLFFALAGERFDGHDFLAAVAKQGVADSGEEADLGLDVFDFAAKRLQLLLCFLFAHLVSSRAMLLIERQRQYLL